LGIVARHPLGERKGWFAQRLKLGIPGAFAQRMKTRGHVVETVGDNVDDAFLPLQSASAAQQSRAKCRAAETFEDLRPDDQIGDPGLVLDRD
jgi:hypothetical protein